MAISPKTSAAETLHRAFLHVASPLGAVLALSACGSMGWADDPSQVVSYVYKPQVGYVRKIGRAHV